MKLETSLGEYDLGFPLSSKLSTQASPLSWALILYGTRFENLLVSSSSFFLPISLFIAKRVFSGFVTACLLADWPTSLSPFSVKATIEGVVLAPSEFSITLASLPSIMAKHEFVVPRSIPITLPIIQSSY